MKREGRQHGMVRSCRILPSPVNPRPNTRFVNKFDSPPTAGLFTKVTTKPTNHSKFTGKCGTPRCTGCHLHPACKSKDKTKGTQKLKSSDSDSNYKFITWRVVDDKHGLSFSGFSATGIVDHLSSKCLDDEEEEDQKDDYNDFTDEYRTLYGSYESYGDDRNGIGGESDISFCDGEDFVLDQVEEDEGWCLVE
ncbi:Histone-lysine N-methyltransferase trithorax-like protein [Quillaja saponaria]|uniref:Histone-lysine N-methyltransferase trithorax-like protein n=1 Tax=Quillaja saponaria TaxID=32244 RepID=A0AAD7M662_QUISA|nr:Histone-lysine N-methyltransferase trithorax-like protein [Quillaja saponaria]